MSVPDGAQLSEDGNYWWDDSSQEWRSVSDDAKDQGGGGTAAGQLSEDGQYRWDGSQWQPVENEGGEREGEDGGSADGSDTITLPDDLKEELTNFWQEFPETAALQQYGNDSEGYAMNVIGLNEIPSEHDEQGGSEGEEATV